MGTYTVDLGPEDHRELAAHAFAPSSASRLRSLKRVYDPGRLFAHCLPLAAGPQLFHAIKILFLTQPLGLASRLIYARAAAARRAERAAA